ncbi:MAG: hypothetical protein Q7S21_01730 [archaeon]|nr:hypothetical protein [archaeon]
MAVANEIIVLILGSSIALFVIFLLMIRASNSIISQKHHENRQRIHHLGKIAKNHSGKLEEFEKHKTEISEKHKAQEDKHEILARKLAEIEKKLEKKEILDSTHEMIAKAIRENKQR